MKRLLIPLLCVGIVAGSASIFLGRGQGASMSTDDHAPSTVAVCPDVAIAFVCFLPADWSQNSAGMIPGSVGVSATAVRYGSRLYVTFLHGNCGQEPRLRVSVSHTGEPTLELLDEPITQERLGVDAASLGELAIVVVGSAEGEDPTPTEADGMNWALVASRLIEEWRGGTLDAIGPPNAGVDLEACPPVVSEAGLFSYRASLHSWENATRGCSGSYVHITGYQPATSDALGSILKLDVATLTPIASGAIDASQEHDHPVWIRDPDYPLSNLKAIADIDHPETGGEKDYVLRLTFWK
jgi:hypothetical protein